MYSNLLHITISGKSFISFFVRPYGTSMVGPHMQACECVCVSLISTRAAPFSRVFLGTYNLLVVVIVDKVPSSCGSIVSSRSQAFEGYQHTFTEFSHRFWCSLLQSSTTFYERMEDYIERDIPNGATAGEGLFSGNTILHTIFVLCRSLVYFQFPRLPFFYYYYYHKTFFSALEPAFSSFYFILG